MAPALLTGVALLANALSLPPTRVAATAAHTHTNMRSGKRQAVAIHRVGVKGESDHSTTEDAASPSTERMVTALSGVLWNWKEVFWCILLDNWIVHAMVFSSAKNVF